MIRMKNFEKYKTAEEAQKAHDAFCKKQDGCCEVCPAYNNNPYLLCSMVWLYLEVEKE